jgi:hypothetical protein
MEPGSDGPVTSDAQLRNGSALHCGLLTVHVPIFRRHLLSIRRSRCSGLQLHPSSLLLHQWKQGYELESSELTALCEMMENVKYQGAEMEGSAPPRVHATTREPLLPPRAERSVLLQRPNWNTSNSLFFFFFEVEQ